MTCISGNSRRDSSSTCGPPPHRSFVGNTADYQVFVKGGRTLNVEDSALFQAESAFPCIGILRKEHPEEVNELLDRTKLEMHAAIQPGGPSPSILSEPRTSQHLKGASESVQNSSYSAAGKCKKKERFDQTSDPIKRERKVKFEDADASPLNRERSMKPEELISSLNKDGGLVNVVSVDCLVQLMQQAQNAGNTKVADVTGRRTKLANVIAATEKEECLICFLQLGGLRLLDEWLQEAHKGKVGDPGSVREGDKGVEELLLGLLRALDRLPVDLEALKTCVVGKSVNHLRSHKNLEIQKKARKLIDVWKKRVDSEMKLSGEVKPGVGHGISWSYKQPPSEPVHSLSTKGSGAPAEVAVKSSGATAGNSKTVSIEAISGDSPFKSTAGKDGPFTLPAVKDKNSKLSPGNSGSDVHVNLSKDEKSSSLSHYSNNGYSWASGAGKSATMAWIDEAKNGVAMPSNINLKVPGGGSRVPNVNNRVSGGNPTSGLKEIGSGKPSVLSRNSASDKASSPVGGTEKGNVESGRSQQRFTVSMQNPARSSAIGGIGDGHVSRSSSPCVLERQTSGTLADILEGKTRAQAERPARLSPESSGLRSGDDRKSGDSGSGFKAQDHGDEGVGDDDNVGDSDSERSRELSHQRSIIDRSRQGEVSARMLGGVENGIGGSPRSFSMDSDEGAMGLLATVAAAAEESVRKSSKKIDNSCSIGQADMEIDGITLEKKTGLSQSYAHHDDSRSAGLGGKKSDRKDQHNASNALEQCAGGEKSVGMHDLRGDATNGEVPASTPNMVEIVGGRNEEGRVDDGNRNLTVEHSLSKEYKVNGRHDSDSKLIGFDGHLTSKFGKREVGSEDRGLSRMYSKVGMTAIELCNGTGVRSGDYRSSFGAASLDSKLLDQRLRKKSGLEVGQLFGRRGDADAQRIADFVSGFPEEDVLEVARQAADEVEQMEKYGTPVSSSFSERDVIDSRLLGDSSAAETRDPSVDLSDRVRVSSVVLDKVIYAETDAQDQRCSERNVQMHLDDSREDTAKQLGDIAEVATGCGSRQVYKLDVSHSDQRHVKDFSPLPIGQLSYLVLETSQEESREVDSNRPLPRGSPLHCMQAEGFNVFPPVGSQPVVIPSTPQQATESSGLNEAGARGGEVTERPVFDLNEDFGENSNQDDAATPLPVAVTPFLAHHIGSGASASGVAAPVAVLAATKGAFIPPASPLRIKGELGWKGSAATSAFRPAEPRHTPERHNCNGDSVASDASLAVTAIGQKRARPLLEFDLNVADERVIHEALVAATTLSSQGSVLGMSLHNNSVPSSSVSRVTFFTQDSSCVTLLKPESSSSAHPLSNGGSGPDRSSQGQASLGDGRGGLRPSLDLDLNRLDDSDENGMPFSVDLRETMEALGSSARSNNSTTQPQPMGRMMDIDLNDGPSFEEGGGDEPIVHPFMLRKPPAGNVGPPAMALKGLKMGGETMSLSPWFSGPGNGSSGGSLLPFLSGRPLDSGYSVASAHSFLNASAGAGPSPAPAPTESGFCGEMFLTGGPRSATPTVVYPGPDRMIFGGPYGPYPVFGNSSSVLSTLAPFPAKSMPFDDMSNLLPFPLISSQPLVSPGTIASSYARPTYLDVTEMGPRDNVGTCSRPSLDLNSGPDTGEKESIKEDVMHGRLPPLHPGVPVFTDLRANFAQVAASSNPGICPVMKRKEPEGGWNIYTGVGPYK